MIWFQGTRKQLTEELLNATDPDSAADSIVYTVLASGIESSGGQVEWIQKIGEPVSTFTQADINAGRLVYAHTATSAGDYKLPLQVC